MAEKAPWQWWKLNKPLVVFLALVIYIFASFVWWSYLLINNNRQSLEQSKELIRQQYVAEHVDLQGDPPEFKHLEKEYRNQVIMVIGEGLVFLVLLTLAVFQIWRSYRQELNLANQQRNFLLSITHELKSPIASIKLVLETLTKREVDPEKRAKLLMNSLSDTNRLQNLVEDILFAAKFEDHTFEFAQDNIQFSDLVSRLSQKISERRPDHRFKFKIEPDLTITGDRQALNSMVANVLENAVKYSPQNSLVSVSLWRNTSDTVLEITDQGIGIPDGEKHNIFKKFYRVGSEDTRRTKGTGLGLFIVKEVADGHGAKIKLEDNTPSGTIFRVCFPDTEKPDNQMTA